MAQPQTNTTCDDCISILQDAASLLSSESLKESSPALFDAERQARLVSNVSSSKCHMCALLSAEIPRLLQSFSSGESLYLQVFRAEQDPHAATLGLMGFERGAEYPEVGYPGTLHIQHGENL